MPSPPSSTLWWSPVIDHTSRRAPGLLRWASAEVNAAQVINCLAISGWTGRHRRPDSLCSAGPPTERVSRGVAAFSVRTSICASACSHSWAAHNPSAKSTEIKHWGKKYEAIKSKLQQPRETCPHRLLLFFIIWKLFFWSFQTTFVFPEHLSAADRRARKTSAWMLVSSTTLHHVRCSEPGGLPKVICYEHFFTTS